MNLIDRDAIASMIPHAGSMILLDSVLNWNMVSISCLSRCHRYHANPLRRANGVLGAASAIELAAQAMAVHGSLVATGNGRPSRGYLASLRNVRLRNSYFDQIDDDVIVSAERLMGNTRSATYCFTVGHKEVELVSGRATVLLNLETE